MTCCLEPQANIWISNVTGILLKLGAFGIIYIFIQENTFENFVCRLSILFRSRCITVVKAAEHLFLEAKRGYWGREAGPFTLYSLHLRSVTKCDKKKSSYSHQMSLESVPGNIHEQLIHWRHQMYRVLNADESYNGLVTCRMVVFTVYWNEDRPLRRV